MSFHDGQLVVCVNAAAPEAGYLWGGGVDDPDFAQLVQGRVYTVRDSFHAAPHWLPLVRLVEVRREMSLHHSGEEGFAASRFRPVDDTKLSVFRSMLKDVPVSRETVDVP